MKYILLVIYILTELVNIMMLYLNRKERSKGIPEELKDFYNKVQFNKWLNYKNDTDRFNIIKTIINIIICIIYLLSPVYSFISNLFPSNILINSICMATTISLFETIISSIEDYYRNFVIEEKFKMNKMTKKTFMIDIVKDFILNILITIILFIFVHFFYQWFSYTGFIILFVVLALVVYIIQKNSLLILKIYNKFTEIDNGELKDKLISLVEKHGFQLKGIYVMDASKRTKRANAFCLGNGKKKEICIDDNMFNQYSDDEIIAVFSHELGHAVYKHGNKLKWLTYVNIVILYITFILVLLNPSIYFQYITNTNYYMVMFVTGIIVQPITFLMNILTSYYSRKCEYEADSFANEEGYGEYLINILKKLTRDDLSDVMPHPIVVKLTYSHPTLLQRIYNIRGEDK